MSDVEAHIISDELFPPVLPETPAKRFKVIPGSRGADSDGLPEPILYQAGWANGRRWDRGRRRPARPPKEPLGPRGCTPLVSGWVGRAARTAVAHFDELAAESRPFFDSPEWVDELVGAAAWRQRFSYHFRRPAHINVLEGVAYGTLLRDLAATRPGSRPVIVTDSRVVLGASAKGRSSSAALNAPLRKALPYLLGGDLYPGGLHTRSELNPADDPSRDRPVRSPLRERPAWLGDLAAGSYARFDAVVGSSAVPRLLGRWVRLLLLLGGDLEHHVEGRPFTAH